MSILSLSESESKTLLNSVSKNCIEAEDLALRMLRSRHIPLLNTMSCLTRDDCRFILDNCHTCLNIVERCVMLIAVTDFLSCVSANSERFPLSGRGERGIKTLFLVLGTQWKKFFSELTVKDMNMDQISTMITVINRCKERIPNNDYRILMEVILNMAERTSSALKRFSNNCILASDKDEFSSVISLDHKDSLEEQSSTEKPVQNIEKKSQSKRKRKESSYDITKFILKACENKVTTKSKEQENCVSAKRKAETMNADEDLLHEAETEKSIVLIHIDAPPSKRQCLNDDLINGKVNAFKRLMKSQKREKVLCSPQVSKAVANTINKEYLTTDKPRLLT